MMAMCGSLWYLVWRRWRSGRCMAGRLVMLLVVMLECLALVR